MSGETVDGLMELVENFAFEAGKTAIYVAEGGTRNTPDHTIKVDRTRVVV